MNDFTSKVTAQKQERANKTSEDKRTAALMNAITTTNGEQIKLAREIRNVLKELKGDEIAQVRSQLSPLLVKFVDSIKKLDGFHLPSEITVNTDNQSVVEAVESLKRTVEDKDTTVQVDAPNVTVEAPVINLKPLETIIKGLKDSPTDFSELQAEVSKVEKAVRDLIARPIPVPEAPHSFKNGSNEGTQGLVDTDGHVQVDVLTMPAVSVEPAVGAATEAKQDTMITHLDGVEGLLTTIDADTSVLAGAVSGTEVQVDVLTMPTTTVQATNLDIRDLTATDVVTAVDSQPSSATVSSVAGSASSVQLLASNTSRKLATFYNDSSADLYLKWGTTASTSSFTVKMAANSYYELPRPVYTGRIDGIWGSATGNVRITEA